MSDARVAPGAPGVSGSLSQVLPSVGALLDVQDFTDSLGLADSLGGATDYRVVVVLLVDGLGWRQLLGRFDLAPTLLSGSARPIHAPFPSTTPVGLASLGIGVEPGIHGVLGATFWLPEYDTVLHPLSWRDEPLPLAVQPEPTMLERLARAGIDVRSVGPRAFAESGLTRATLRGGRYVGADGFGERLIATTVPFEGPGVVYAYWGDLDKTGHVHGVASAEWEAELRHVDALVQAIRAALPADAALVVTADHGMVDVTSRIDLDGDRLLTEGVVRLAGEPRMRHVYARGGSGPDVARRWASVLGESAVVLERHEAIGAGLFGDVWPEFHERIGDVVAIATDGTALASDRTDSVVSSLRGQHGGRTPEESEIPLLCLPGGG